MRTTPRVRFSLARRTVRAASSSPAGGRPGGWQHSDLVPDAT
jgi:hypothetical protein